MLRKSRTDRLISTKGRRGNAWWSKNDSRRWRFWTNKSLSLRRNSSQPVMFPRHRSFLANCPVISPFMRQLSLGAAARRASSHGGAVTSADIAAFSAFAVLERFVRFVHSSTRCESTMRYVSKAWKQNTIFKSWCNFKIFVFLLNNEQFFDDIGARK